MIESRARGNGVWWIVGGVLLLLLFGCLLTTALIFFALRGGGGPASADPGAIRPAPAQPAPAQQLVVPTPAPAVVIAPPENGMDYETAVLVNIYEQVNPSVVNITRFASGTSLQGLRGTFQEGDLVPLGSGSGFVWDREGHIVTNHHVVEGAAEVQVTFNDGTASVAEIVGSDPNSDLAVLKIDPTGYTLFPVRRGNLDEVRVGMRVAAIGNPFGLEGTLTSGIVSAMGRSIPALASFSIPNSIQTDAPINPGNSGGPLLNERGEVIGVNAQIRSETGVNSGVGFAIPITIVDRVVPALIADGRYDHSYLGVSGITLSPICAEDLGVERSTRGAYLQEVLPGTPAARAGLRGGSQESNTRYFNVCPRATGGDIVVAINEQPVVSFDDILRYLESDTSPGDTVTLRILRRGDEYLIDVTLAPRPERVQP
jgi:S1-C subfamily serine protease